MKLRELFEDGRIVKGVNTTVDVGPNEIKTQTAKFGNTVDKDGVPPTLSKKVKGKSTNVLFNLGLTEGYQLKLERDEEIDVLHIMDTKTKKRIEVRGKKGYETNGYDPQDKLHQVLDKVGRSANISELMNGKVVGINPKHPQGADAEKTAKDVLTTESFIGLEESLNLAEAIGEIASATEIYVDMDGVLADFFGEWAKLMQVDHFTDIDKQHDINDALQKIRDTDDFWLRLPVLPEAKNLLNLIKEVKGEYSICTSPLADDPNSEKHKRTWVEKNLAFFPPKAVYVTHNKPQFATAKDGTPNILIDDYGVNINAWEAAGGIGFKYKDHKFERTAKDIKQHMDAPVEESFPRDVDAEIKSDQDQYKETFNVYRQGVDTYLEDDLVLTPEIIKTWSDSWKRFPTLIPNLMDYYKKKKAYKGENFADGKKPGRKGLSQRVGIPKNATIAQLEKAAKSGGEKGRMARWQLNMRRGKNK